MTPLLQLIIIIGLVLLPFIIIFTIFWKEILNFLKPNLFWQLEILLNDNTVKNVLFFRGFSQENKSYQWNKINYTPNSKVMYIKGNNRKYYFQEGVEEPIDYRKIDTFKDVALKDVVDKQMIIDLFTPNKNMGDIVKDILPFLLIVLVAGGLYYLWKSKGG